jgi:hypothetical protein
MIEDITFNRDIIASKLAHLDVRLDSNMPYEWRAKTQLDQTMFTGNGFTPGSAVEMLYSVMIRHLARREETT